MYMVHRPHRLIEIIAAMKQYKMEPKRMCMVHPFKDKEANMVLIEAVRGKPIKPEREAMVHLIGMLFLFSLMIFFTYKDIVRIFFN